MLVYDFVLKAYFQNDQRPLIGMPLTSVVCHGRHNGNDRALLSTTRGTGRDEDTGVFAIISTGSPLAASGIPERLPLSWEVTITGGNANEERIVALEGLGIDDWDIGLGRSVHLKRRMISEN
jgi:hypothetical protein